MAAVATLLGPVDTSELGVTLMHEHIMLVNPEIDSNYPGWWDLETEIPEATARLRDLKAQGVDTVVDLTVLGLGRNIELVKRIAEPTGINVIVATGAYYFDDLPFFFKNRGPGSFNGGGELLTEFFLKDIEQGIANTGIRAGILKCATDAKGVTPDGDRILRAIAHAHRQTGAPISTHTHAATRRGLDQQRIFQEEGVDLSNVVIGHSGDSSDLAYLTKLMEAGSYIGMDRFGLDIFLPTPQRIETVVELARQGYAERMVLSHDTSCITISYDHAPREEKLPDWRFSFLLEKAVPTMLERGVSQDDIDQMLVRNPRAIFGRGLQAASG
jgi:phosphotriesterase-related protein